MASMASGAAMVVAGFASIALASTAGLAAGESSSSTAERPPALPLERSDTAVLDPAGPHRVVTLAGWGSTTGAIVEGGDDRLTVVAAVPMASNAAMVISRDASKIFISETYWSHGNRGERADLVSVYDGNTLDLEKEIPIPGRLHVVSKLGQMGISDDGALVYVYSMIPASQIYAVDWEKGEVVGSANVPGCALVYPYGPRSFATICGDGTVGAATLPAGGGTAEVSFSERFFDPDHDPIFENSLVDRTTGEGYLLSYSGKIYPAKFGATAEIGEPWSINEAAGMPVAGTGVQELAWRPGGGQLMALHRSTKRLYVLMHPGNFWTQKDAGSEVWVIDTQERKVVKRIDLNSDARGIAVTQDAEPVLFTFGSEGGGPAAFSAYDAETGEFLRTRPLSTSVAHTLGM